MQRGLYSIFDKKAGVYAAPFMEINDGTAIRAVQDLVQRKDTSPAKYPEDYQLCFVGSFDEETGEVYGECKIVMPLQQLVTGD